MQRNPILHSVVHVDIEKPKIETYELDEYRTRLQDDYINFMNLA